MTWLVLTIVLCLMSALVAYEAGYHAAHAEWFKFMEERNREVTDGSARHSDLAEPDP